MIKDSEDIKLAVAFWGTGAGEIIKKAKNKKLKIICNIESGATNPYEIIKIGKVIGFRNIKSVKNLHAKVYCTDNKAILGSSNFSANGLCLEGNETNNLIEANLLIEDSLIISQVKSWFNYLWMNGKKVDEIYCEKYMAKWNENRKRVKKKKVNDDYFTAYENGEIENDVYIIIDTLGFTPAEEKAGDKIAEETLGNDLFYKGKEIS